MTWLFKIVLHKQNSHGEIWVCKSNYISRVDYTGFLCFVVAGECSIPVLQWEESAAEDSYITCSLARWGSNLYVTNIFQPLMLLTTFSFCYSSLRPKKEPKACYTISLSSEVIHCSTAYFGPAGLTEKSILCPFGGERKDLRWILQVSLMFWK